MADADKKTGVSFECTQRQRDSYIKAAGGRKLGAWIQSVLDDAVRNSKRKPSPVVDDDAIGNR